MMMNEMVANFNIINNINTNAKVLFLSSKNNFQKTEKSFERTGDAIQTARRTKIQAI